MKDPRFKEVLNPNLYPLLDEIFANMETDFTANVSGYFSDEDLEKIFTRATDLLYHEVSKGLTFTANDLSQSWNKVVADFHHNSHWGFVTTEEPPAPPSTHSDENSFPSFIRTFLISALILKPGVYYFGLQYSKYPGEGYGWGLIFTITFSLVNIIVLLYRYRHMSD